jgi:chemotaxis protein CheD
VPSTLNLEAPSETSVGMGQVAVTRQPGRLKAVLGSCVGVALYHPSARAGALAHVVLPEAAGRAEHPGKFADTAVPHLLKLLAREGVPAAGLIAKIAGGANMFGHTGPLRIGDNNIQAVLNALRAAGLHVSGQDVGGGVGRRVTLDCASGEFVVEIAGQRPRSL